MLNTSSLFNSSVEAPTFLQNLDLTDDQLEQIASAKTSIRSCLRDKLKDELIALGCGENAVNPRFFTQGSFAYKTLNSPAHRSQQADIDDGVYLPLSFVTETGVPSVAAQTFFRAAERALSDLANANGWRLDTSKATCIRVEIASFAHVDIPLYAIPDAEFSRLEKMALANARPRLDGFTDAGDVDTDVWEKLPKDSVLLAHRTENWKKSDPRPIKDWFLDQVALHGEQLRRVVRYLKAFRDWKWETGGPSSILLMAAACQDFEAKDRRDDLSLLTTAEQIPGKLRSGVSNPVDSSESLTDRLGPQGVEEAAKAFEQFAAAMRSALSGAPNHACAALIDQLGQRFPNEPGRIKQDNVANTVHAVPPAVVAPPLVGRTRAG
jgi:hypothetical protein